MYDFQKEATVLLGDEQVKLGGFGKEKCYTYIMLNKKWVSVHRWSGYLFGIRFKDGKLELLFDERPRRYSDPQAWRVMEYRPSDETSSNVLKELFEDWAIETIGAGGIFVKNVPLAWPW